MIDLIQSVAIALLAVSILLIGTVTLRGLPSRETKISLKVNDFWDAEK